MKEIVSGVNICENFILKCVPASCKGFQWEVMIVRDQRCLWTSNVPEREFCSPVTWFCPAARLQSVTAPPWGQNMASLFDSSICVSEWVRWRKSVIHVAIIVPPTCPCVALFADHGVCGAPAALAGSRHLLRLRGHPGAAAPRARRVSAPLFVSGRRQRCLSPSVCLAGFHLDAVFPSVSVQWSMRTQIWSTWLQEPREDSFIISTNPTWRLLVWSTFMFLSSSSDSALSQTLWRETLKGWDAEEGRKGHRCQQKVPAVMVKCKKAF